MKRTVLYLGLTLIVASVVSIIYTQQVKANIHSTPPPRIEDTEFDDLSLDRASQNASDLTIQAMETSNRQEREHLLQKVIGLYTYLHESDPNQPSHLNNRGATYIFLEEYENAIADFSLVLEQYPMEISARSNRALAYKEIGELESSAIDFQIYLAIVEEHPASSWEEGALGQQLELINAQFEEVKEALLQQGKTIPEIDRSLFLRAR